MDIGIGRDGRDEEKDTHTSAHGPSIDVYSPEEFRLTGQ